MIKALVTLGLSRVDAEVYVYLGKNGSQKLKDLVSALNYSKQKIRVTLEILIAKTLVTEVNNEFSAISFEEALESLIQSQREEERILAKSKKDIVEAWTKNS